MTKKPPKPSPRRRPGDLTDRQKRFVQEYILDLDATAAYQRAGYKVKASVAKSAANRLLTNVAVREAVNAAQAARSTRTEIKADKVLAELARIAFSNMRDYAEWGPGGVVLRNSSELSDDAVACVLEVSETRTETGGSQKFKLHDKLGALRELVKHLGLAADSKHKHEHSGPGGKPIEVALSDAERRQALIDLREALKGIPGACEALAGFVQARAAQLEQGKDAAAKEKAAG